MKKIIPAFLLFGIVGIILGTWSSCTQKQQAPQMEAAIDTSSVIDLSSALKDFVPVAIPTTQNAKKRSEELQGSDSLYQKMPMRFIDYSIYHDTLKHDTIVTLALKKNYINPIIIMSDGSKDVSKSTAIHYIGKILGRDSSNAAITMNGTEPSGVFGDKDWGTFNAVKVMMSNARFAAAATIVYNEMDLIGQRPNFENDELPIPDAVKVKRDLERQIQKQRAAAAPGQKCVRLNWEIKYEIYAAKGAGTADFMKEVFNQVQALNAISNIPVKLDAMKINVTPDGFTGPSTADFLMQWQAYLKTPAAAWATGDVKMLIGTSGGGGIAWVDGLCTTDYNNGYCGISLSLATVPTYSWTVEVITHEQGHVMGSQHTHDCVWNGNNTRIDDCGTHSGYATPLACGPDIPNPVNGGTVMSYCHLNYFINFALGFGPLPAQRILDNIASSSCLVVCDTSGCTKPGQPTAITGNMSVNAGSSNNYSVPSVLGATFYTWTIPSGWTGTSTTNSITTIAGSTGGIITVSANNACGTGPLQNTIVTVIATACNAPVGLSSSALTFSSATVSWGAVMGATSYSVQYRITGAATWGTPQTVAATTLNLSGLSASTSYQWQVQTVCASGSSAFVVSSFTTSGLSNCAYPDNRQTSLQTINSARASWAAIPGVSFYWIEWRQKGVSAWSKTGTGSNFYIMRNLFPATNYEWHVAQNCLPPIPVPQLYNYSPLNSFITIGAPPVDTCASKPPPTVDFSFCVATDGRYTFSSVVTTGVSYIWKKNGVQVATTQNYSLVSGLVHGDQITLTVTEISGCKKSNSLTKTL